MTREMVVDEIVQALLDRGCLDVCNYHTIQDQCDDVHCVIERALDGYLLMKGEVILNE